MFLTIVKYLHLSSLFIFLTVSCFSLSGRGHPPSTPALKDYRRALHWMERGDLLQAEAFFRFAVAKDSLFPPAYLGLGQINLQRGKPTEARRWLEKALRIDKNYLPAGLLHARLLWRQQEYEAAEMDLHRCRQLLNPGTSKTLQAEVYLLEGRVSGKLLNFTRAAEYYQKVLQLFPGHPEARKELEQMQEYLKYSKGLSAAVKAIIFKKQITRADLAALLAVRLNFLIDSLDAEPVSGETVPLQTPVERAVRQGWLPLLPDSSFRPNDVVDRAELTLFLCHILLKYRSEAVWKGRYTGRAFDDVADFNPLYPFVQLATAFNLLDFISGNDFFARKPVSGLEAFRSCQRLRELLKAPPFPANRQGQEGQHSK